MTEHHGDSARAALKRLIHSGLAGRSLPELLRQLVDAFSAAGEVLSESTFYRWVAGESFPSTRRRQRLLGDVIGGSAGQSINNLRGPAFRGFRRRVMRETEEHMSSGSMHFGAAKAKTTRLFPHISVKGEDGRTHQRPLIMCAECGARETCVRHNSEEAEDKFARKGWEVGKSMDHDYCPMCVKKRANKQKVVKMEDHVKNNGAGSSSGMSKEDGRILSRLIEDRWDDQFGRYKPGWSDAKLAEEVGKPIEWVRERRELDFGGSGEDPGIIDFLQLQVALNSELETLRSQMEALAGSVSELASSNQRVQRQLEKYRDGHNALATKATRLQEVAAKLSPFSDRKTA